MSKKKKEVVFRLGDDYILDGMLGRGAYGIVCSALYRPLNIKVAIKKIAPLDHAMFAVRTLREIKILRYFRHDNIVGILDLIKPDSFDDFNEVYLIQELMDTDLHRVICSQELTDDHCQYFTYQILRALKCLHSANVIHRDLKPSNILLNSNCDLKICDFGLARIVNIDVDTMRPGFMTEYVATRWYRAPEIMLTFKEYTQAIDVWSVGCILSEMLTGKPLFPGRDYHHQLSLILDVLGSPTHEDFVSIKSFRAREYIRGLPLRVSKPLEHIHKRATASALDLLGKLLTFNPKNRYTVEQALTHPYLQAYHDPDDEPIYPVIPSHLFQFECESKPLTKEQLKMHLFNEITTPQGYYSRLYLQGLAEMRDSGHVAPKKVWEEGSVPLAGGNANGANGGYSSGMLNESENTLPPVGSGVGNDETLDSQDPMDADAKYSMLLRAMATACVDDASASQSLPNGNRSISVTAEQAGVEAPPLSPPPPGVAAQRVGRPA